MDSQHHYYFVWRNPSSADPYRVVFREVINRTKKGIPISYRLKAAPEEYDTWGLANAMADALNSHPTPIKWVDSIGKD